MKKLIYLGKRIIHLNYKSFFKTIKQVHYKTGKSRIYIFFDMVYCGLKYQAGYVDYNLFEMYDMTKEERKTVITRGINNQILKKCNNPAYFHIFHNKNEFNEKFEQYLNRDWLYLDNNEKEFKDFIKKHPSFIAKPTDLECGKKVELIDAKKKNAHELYETLIENHQFLLEEVAKQCKEIASLHPYSINTIRIVTLKSHIVTAFIRIGDKKNVVDNFNYDGLLASIDIETGKVNFPAVKKNGTTYTHHPLTKKPILGITIPKWEEAKSLCIEASKIVPEIGYIGFDVCIGPEKCSLIEANEFPGHDLYALPAHRNKKEGLLPRFNKILNANDDGESHSQDE